MGQAGGQPPHHRKRLRFGGLLEHVVLAIGFEHDRELDVADLVDDPVVLERSEAVVGGPQQGLMKA